MALHVQWDWIRSSAMSPRELVGVHLPEFRRRVSNHREKWYINPNGRSYIRRLRPVDMLIMTELNRMSAVEATFLNWITTERTLAIECHGIRSCFSPEELDSSMDRCLVVITEQVEGVERLLELGVLRYLQDVASCLLSNTATFIHEVSRKVPGRIQ